MMQFSLNNYKYRQVDACTFEIIALDDNGVKIQKIVFGRNNDYYISIYNLNDFSQNFGDSIDFTFVIKKDNVLYNNFSTFLTGMDIISINDDFSKGKQICIQNSNGDILFHLTSNNTSDQDVVKNAVQIKNVLCDLRSEVDQQGTDIKKRLFDLFESVYMDFDKQEKGKSYILK